MENDDDVRNVNLSEYANIRQSVVSVTFQKKQPDKSENNTEEIPRECNGKVHPAVDGQFSASTNELKRESFEDRENDFQKPRSILVVSRKINF